MIQFDYVTGVLLFWVVGTSALVCVSLWILSEVLKYGDRRRTEAKFNFVDLEMTRFDTRLKGIEKLWVDSQKKTKVK